MNRRYYRFYAEAEAMLIRTFEAIKHQHQKAGHDYINTHWRRYVNLVMRFPPVDENSAVLEIGASILSNLVKREFKASVHTIYHELEPEWQSRFEQEGIKSHPCEMMRDPLPVADSSFDVILFDEVMEHFPLRPEFVLRQIIGKLKPDGRLMFSVPNFATSEKRLALFCGRNPQDPMDETFIYYAHHREPVMAECVSLIAQCGGEVLHKEWIDYDSAPSWRAGLWQSLRHLRHGKIHRMIHQLHPSTRGYIFICAGKSKAFKSDAGKMVPPLARTHELQKK